MKKNKDTFWAWLAGFIDGDGSIGCYYQSGRSVPRVTIAQKERDVLDYIVECVGTGSVGKRGHTSTGNVMHALVFGSKKSRELCEEIYPYLWIKKVKAKAVINWKPKAVHERRNYRCNHPKHDECIRRYKAGESANTIHLDTGVKGSTILDWARKLGVSRTFKESQRLRRKREADESANET